MWSNGTPFIATGNIRWSNHLGCSLIVCYKLNIFLPYDPAVILFAIFPKELKTYVYIIV
jgi:hypothetical protein